jgi:hypothetical protein
MGPCPAIRSTRASTFPRTSSGRSLSHFLTGSEPSASRKNSIAQRRFGTAIQDLMISNLITKSKTLSLRPEVSQRFEIAPAHTPPSEYATQSLAAPYKYFGISNQASCFPTGQVG